MHVHRRRQIVLPLLIATAFAVPAAAQQQPAPAAPAAPAPAKPAVKPAAKPKPAATAKPAAPAATKPAAPATASDVKPTLLGQYGDWGAYTATPGGKKVCFAISKPTSAETNPPNRPRNPIYMFISSRPADKVTSEVSIIIGYPFKPGSEAS